MKLSDPNPIINGNYSPENQAGEIPAEHPYRLRWNCQTASDVAAVDAFLAECESEPETVKGKRR